MNRWSMKRRQIKRTLSTVLGVGLTGMALVAGVSAGAGEASAATATNGCSRLVVNTGSSGYQAIAGIPANGCAFSNTYGHFQITGPNLSINGPTNGRPGAVGYGHGSGWVCATLWEHKPNNVYVNRGRACVHV